eukprot:1171674-Alexandrium_andersonii.AAC.1
MFEEWMAFGVPLREALKEHRPKSLAGGGDCDSCRACTECPAAWGVWRDIVARSSIAHDYRL